MSSQLSSARKRTKAIVISVVIAIGVVVIAVTSTRAAQQRPEALLPDATSMGVVELNVNDLPSMRDYYVEAVGLEVLSEGDGSVMLGHDLPLLHLVEGEGASTVSAMEAGLYHSAILYPDEASLANVIYNVATIAPQSFQGSADHAVSLAFYFVDPEGNGLELYVDTPRDEWKWVDGEVQMGSAPLDPNAFIQEHLGESSTDVAMGHVHLKVGDLGEAEAFYADVLGFAVTARSDGALFYAAGGYHHHLATNMWQSPGAGERTNMTGLGSLSIVLPDAAAIETVIERLEAANHDYETVEGGLSTVDPWGNVVRLTA